MIFVMRLLSNVTTHGTLVPGTTLVGSLTRIGVTAHVDCKDAACCADMDEPMLQRDFKQHSILGKDY